MSPRLAATYIIGWQDQSQADHTSSTDRMHVGTLSGFSTLEKQPSPSEDILVGVFAHDGQSGIAAWAPFRVSVLSLQDTGYVAMAAWHRMARRALNS